MTAAQRPYNWARDLHKYGFYPIVITRNWDIQIQDQIDLGRSSGDRTRIENHGNYEVHFVPYRASWRDKQYAKRFGRSNLLIKMATFFELFGQYYSTWVLPYRNILKYADSFISSYQGEVRWLISIVQPWTFLSFATILKRKYPEISWIADYRDDWNTAVLGKHSSLMHRFLDVISRRKEPQWLASAVFFTSVSKNLVKRIQDFTGKQGYVVSNGFDKKSFTKLTKLTPVEKDKFVVTYSGYLYNEQRIEVFLTGFKRFCDKYGQDCEIVLQFIGLDYYPPSADRVRMLMLGYEQYLKITPRIPIEECAKMELSSDILLMIAYGNEKGIPASKLYQYIGCERPILLCPSDHDIIEHIVTSENVGACMDTAEEVMQFLSDQYLIKKYNKESVFDFSGRDKYSRERQTEILASHISKAISQM